LSADDDLRGRAVTRLQPELAAEWLPSILSDEYDPRFVPASQNALC